MGAKELIEKAELAASGRLYNKTSSKDDSRLFMELAAYLRLSEAREQQQERQLDQLKGRINELGLSVVPRSQFDECQEALRVAEKARDELDAQAQQLLFERDTAERKAGCATAAERAKHHHVLRRYADTVVRGVAAARMAMDLSTELAQVRAELRRLTELRPIAEAPRDGKVIAAWLNGQGQVEREEVITLSEGHLRNWHDEPFYCPIMGDPTHFRPLEGPR